MSPQYILSEGITDKVEMGMTGFGAKHSYMSVGNASAVYQDVLIQVRGWMIMMSAECNIHFPKLRCSTRWLCCIVSFKFVVLTHGECCCCLKCDEYIFKVERFWINNLTPGPEACENFEDASSILGSVLPVQHTCQRFASNPRF